MIIIYAHTTNDAMCARCEWVCVCAKWYGRRHRRYLSFESKGRRRQSSNLYLYRAQCRPSCPSVAINVSVPMCSSATSIAMANIIVVNILHISLMISTSRVHTHALLLHWFNVAAASAKAKELKCINVLCFATVSVCPHAACRLLRCAPRRLCVFLSYFCDCCWYCLRSSNFFYSFFCRVRFARTAFAAIFDKFYGCSLLAWV